MLKHVKDIMNKLFFVVSTFFNLVSHTHTRPNVSVERKRQENCTKNTYQQPVGNSNFFYQQHTLTAIEKFKIKVFSGQPSTTLFIAFFVCVQ